MKTIKYSIIIVLSLFIFCGCAGSYKTIDPQKIQYKNGDKIRDLPVAYQYDVLKSTRNRKYTRKAYDADIKLVSVRITNNTDSSLSVNDDIIFYHGNTPIDPMDPEVIQDRIKQKPAGYLFYLFFVSLSLVTEDGQNIPVGWILAPTLTLGNVLISASANQNLLLDLNTYSLIGKSIPPKQTLYGIIGISNMGYSPISAEIARK